MFRLRLLPNTTIRTAQWLGYLTKETRRITVKLIHHPNSTFAAFSARFSGEKNGVPVTLRVRYAHTQNKMLGCPFKAIPK